MNLRAATLARVVAAALLVSALVGCGSDGASSTAPTSTAGSSPSGEPLTGAQANTMAQLFFRNHSSGGAEFTIELPSRGQVVATLEGEVDWVGHVAKGTYAATDGTASASPYVWNPEIVLDGGIEGLEPALAAEGNPGKTWVSRPLDPTRFPLDGVMALVHAIASDRPENPQLIAQGDAAYLGREVVDGVALDRFRFGTNNTYLVGVEDGLIHLIEARFRSFSDPVIVRITARGPRSVSSPQKEAVVDAGSIPALYEELTGAAAPTEAAPPPVAPTSSLPG